MSRSLLAEPLLDAKGVRWTWGAAEWRGMGRTRTRGYSRSQPRDQVRLCGADRIRTDDPLLANNAHPVRRRPHRYWTSGFCPVEFAVVRPGAWRLAPTLAGPHLGHSLVADRATAAVRRPYPKVGSEGLLSRLGSLLGLDSTG